MASKTHAFVVSVTFNEEVGARKVQQAVREALSGARVLLRVTGTDDPIEGTQEIYLPVATVKVAPVREG